MKDPNITSQSMIPPKRSKRLIRGEKLRDAQKVEKIPVKIINVDDKLKKPDWLRIRLSSSNKITASLSSSWFLVFGREES